MTKIIAVAIQKGGVGKTTSVAALSEIMVSRGYRTLAVDMDPQSSLTEMFGVAEDDNYVGMLFNKRPAKIANLLRIGVGNGFDLLPSHIELASIEMNMAQLRNNDRLLKTELSGIVDYYDYVFIDSLPGSGKLMDNVLTAATHVLIPVQPSTTDLKGLRLFFSTIGEIKKHTNRKLINAGVFLTMVSSRLNLHREAISQIEAAGIPYTGVSIPRAIDAAVAAGYGQSIATYSPNSKPAMAYYELADYIEQL
jgi:chromosome partitioning protein